MRGADPGCRFPASAGPSAQTLWRLIQTLWFRSCRHFHAPAARDQTGIGTQLPLLHSLLEEAWLLWGQELQVSKCSLPLFPPRYPTYWLYSRL